MEREPFARKRGARIYGELAGYGICNDAHHMTSPHPEACGAIRAMTRALASASIAPAQVDYISAHGTGTLANDKVETLAVKRVFGDTARRTPVSPIKSMLGHTISAASMSAVALCLPSSAASCRQPFITRADPECDLDYVPNQARAGDVSQACDRRPLFVDVLRRVN
jgi:3-oxoacyl-[acyl-carrier-protein] synthase II